MRCLALLLGLLLSQTAYSADYDVKVWSFSPELSDQNAEDTLSDAALILSTDDTPPADVACPTAFVREGEVFDGSSGELPQALESLQDYRDFKRDGRFSLYVVRQITWCSDHVAAAGYSFGGCTSKRGPVIVSLGAFLPVVVAHEFGHGQGLPDLNSPGWVMHGQASDTSSRLHQHECDNFDAPQLFPILIGDSEAAFDEAIEADFLFDEVPDTAMDLPVRELLSGYWHQLPTATIAALTDEEVEEVRQVLREQPTRLWQNALTVLGLRGTASDTALALQAIEQASGATEADIVNSGVPWLEIQTNAALALGALAARTQDMSAIDALYSMMVEPEGANGVRTDSVQSLNDLAKSASIGFQYAGEVAEATYPAGLVQAELSALVRNGVATPETPWASLPLSTDLTTLAADLPRDADLATALQALDRELVPASKGTLRTNLNFSRMLLGDDGAVGPMNAQDVQEFFEGVRAISQSEVQLRFQELVVE